MKVAQRPHFHITDIRHLYQDPEFQALRRMRTRFMLKATLVGLAFNLGLPILSVSTHTLDIKVYGDISLGWIYAFSQFLFAPLLLQIHMKHMQRTDEFTGKLRAKFDVKE